MSKDGNNSHVKDAIGVFENEKDLEAAIDALLTSGFNRADLSLLAGENALREKLGRFYQNVKELEDDPKTPHAAYVSKETIGDAEGAVIGVPMYIAGVTAAGAVAAAGGPFAIALAAAASAAGAGAAIGAVVARMIGRRHADYIEGQLDHGGILLWVRSWDPQEEKTATQILKAHSAHDVHIHDFSADAETITTPESILKSESLTGPEKVSLLQRWEFDIRELLVAEEEGMGDADGSMLSRIVNALAALGAAPDTEHSPPTKQGG